MQLGDSITSVKGVGEQVAKKLAGLGIHTVADLIDYYPRKYNDYSQVTKIKDIKPGPITIRLILPR